MIVSPAKFQATVLKKNVKMKDSYPFNINGPTINSENSAKLFGIEIDNKLPFEQHISTLCNKASNQLNAIGRIQKFMGLRKKKFFLIVLYAQNLVIVLLSGIFAHLNLYIKSKKHKNEHLDYYTTTSLVIMLNSYKNR